MDLRSVGGTIRALPTTWLAGLCAVASLLPITAGAVTAMLYVAVGDVPNWQLFVYSACSVLVAFIVLPMLLGSLGTFEKANRSSASQLEVRRAALQERINRLPEDRNLTPAQQSACIDARAALTGLFFGSGRPALRWALAFGYIDLWRLLHRAEEALMHLDMTATLVGQARRDRFRISGSPMEGTPVSATLDEGLKDLDGADDETRARGRAKLSEVRRAVNEFRDDSWAGLVGARNATDAMVIGGGLTAYALLSLAVVRHVGREQVAVGVGFYLCGVLFGLLARLYAEKDTDRTVEDYGLAGARLLRTLLYSGLAAVGGVVLVAMAKAALVNDVHWSASFPTMTKLFTIDLTAFRFVWAAVFGVSPALLLRFVEKQAEGLKLDIKSTESGQLAPAPAASQPAPAVAVGQAAASATLPQ